MCRGRRQKRLAGKREGRSCHCVGCRTGYRRHAVWVVGGLRRRLMAGPHDCGPWNGGVSKRHPAQSRLGMIRHPAASCGPPRLLACHIMAACPGLVCAVCSHAEPLCPPHGVCGGHWPGRPYSGWGRAGHQPPYPSVSFADTSRDWMPRTRCPSLERIRAGTVSCRAQAVYIHARHSRLAARGATRHLARISGRAGSIRMACGSE